MRRSVNIIAAGMLIAVLTSALALQFISHGAPKGSVDERLGNAAVIYVNSNLALVNNKETPIDSENERIAPFVEKNRTLVPIRFVSECFGAEVSWDAVSSTATIKLKNKNIKITADSSEMYVNKNLYYLDVPAVIVNKRMFVPLRAVSEALGKEVFYDRGLIIISDTADIFDPVSEKSVLDGIISRVNKLPSVGTKENLMQLLKEMTNIGTARKNEAVTNDVSAWAASEAEGTNYSETNVQVQGVDEADIVKTDGSYIYQVSNGNVTITKAAPYKELEIIKKISFKEGSFTPQELYIDKEHLIIIGAAYPVYVRDNNVISKSKYLPYSQNRLAAYIYDISDKQNIILTREIELEGNYVSSRKIGNVLYLVANCGLNYYIYNEEDVPPVPIYRDSAVGDAYMRIPYEDIKYIPPVVRPAYLVVGALDLNSSDGIQVETYLGTGDDIYVSSDNLYISVNAERYGVEPLLDSINNIYSMPEQKTFVYKFSMDGSRLTYLAKGEVPGRVLNQFSMDEHNDYFRIATTYENRDNGYITSNNVYILDSNMNITGRIEDIAPGEQIYSVRYMGDRAYMVTFKTVDPLFVLDLKSPWDPKVLGALKIPGYSDYLHPYDENHIIGFGKDTVELPVKDSKGNELGTTAYYLGMKIALFDVTDVAKPIEKFNVKIGDRGTDSELLRNHKALFFDKERNLLAFPVTVREVKGSAVDERSGFPQYGEITFQGAYVYELSNAEGFNLKGTISHLNTDDYLKSGYYDVISGKEIKRILRIEDILYAVSDNTISAHETDTKEVNRIDLIN